MTNTDARAQETIIDLRSDLLARPTADMCARMSEALQERAFFDLREDPRQLRVERAVAELLGKEDALLFPTCTMANQTALALLTRPGDVVLTQPDAHIITSEAGGSAAIASVQIRPIGDGAIDLDIGAWRPAIEGGGGAQRQTVSAIVLENTHNRSGGRTLPIAAQHALIALAQRVGVAAHLDGARLANAAVANGDSLRDLAADFDTVSISFNKGMGAPFGAALAGSRERIRRALTLRQRLGGGMRRFGVMAAAIEPALQDFSHIHEDHRRARILADALAGTPGLRLACSPVETNIVVVALTKPERTAALVDALARRHVLVLPFDGDRIRLTTYRDVTDADIDHVIGAFGAAIKELDDDAR